MQIRTGKGAASFLALAIAGAGLALPGQAGAAATDSESLSQIGHNIAARDVMTALSDGDTAQQMRQARWGQRVNGRWIGGMQAPGGFAGYQRPFRGFMLPSYWVQPSFFLSNYSLYGLSQPADGYGWSRYYDDAVLTDRQGRVYDTVQNVNWNASGYAYEDGAYEDDQARYHDDQMLTADHRIYGDGVVMVDGQPVTQTGDYQGSWHGNYVDEDQRVYQGSWAGSYQDANGYRYDSEYSGTYIGTGRHVDQDGNVIVTGVPHWQHDAGAQYAPAPVQPAPVQYQAPPPVQYQAPPPAQYGYDSRAELIERCRRDNGVGGALIGGVLGGVAGNRIAGRGNRTAGTLIGAGVGAVTGALIDRAEDDPCDEFVQAPAPQQPAYYPAQPGYGYGYGYGYPGYYYPQPSVTTVVVTGGGAATYTETTTVTEEYVVRQPRRRRHVRRTAPRPQPRRCAC